MRQIPQFTKNLLLNGDTVFLRFFANTSLSIYKEAENAETESTKKQGIVMSVLIPNIDSASRIPLLPNSFMTADTEKLRKNPRTADKKGMETTPRIEKPRKSASKWYLKLLATAENRLTSAEASVKKNER